MHRHRRTHNVLSLIQNVTIHICRQRPLVCYVIHLALELGMPVNSNIMSILELAVYYVRIDITKLALQYNAHVNLPNGRPLHWCLYCDDHCKLLTENARAIHTLLISAGAKANCDACPF